MVYRFFDQMGKSPKYLESIKRVSHNNSFIGNYLKRERTDVRLAFKTTNNRLQCHRYFFIGHLKPVSKQTKQRGKLMLSNNNSEDSLLVSPKVRCAMEVRVIIKEAPQESFPQVNSRRRITALIWIKVWNPFTIQ